MTPLRWLAGLACLAAALVAFLYFATSSGGSVESTDRGEAVERRVDAGEVALGTPTSPSASSESESSLAPDASESQRSANPGARVEPTIRGRVLRADGRPAARVLVGLFAPAARDDGVDSPFAPRFAAQSSLIERLRIVRTWTGTDDDGRFEFTDPEPGTWVVRAEDGPLLASASEPFVLAAHASVHTLEIQLPPEAWLEGQLILPPGARFDDLCLELRALTESSLARWMPTPRDTVVAVRTRIAADATFKLGPLETGLAAVGLVIDAQLERRGRPDPILGTVVPLVDVYLPVGVTRRDIDVRSGFPGSIHLKIDLDRAVAGEPGRRRPARTQLRLIAEPLFDAKEVEMIIPIAWNEIDRDVELDIGPLAPGDWRLCARFGVSGAFTWRLQDFLRVAPAVRTDLSVRMATTLWTIQFLDATTNGVATGELEIGRMETSGLVVETYSMHQDGLVDLTLPPGEYMVTADDAGLEAVLHDARKWAKFVWDEGGPTTVKLHLP